MKGSRKRDVDVLVVEDDEEIRATLGSFLEGNGYTVKITATAMEGLEWLRWGKSAGCVVLDMRMPLMTGWEFRRAMKEDPSLRDIPVIAITGGRFKADDDEHFVALIEKPLDLREIEAAVQRCRDGARGSGEHAGEG